MENEELLISIGLTKQEAHCYLELYKLQEAKTGILCKASGIASAHIYSVLENLMKKGLVSYRLQNNIKIFTANHEDTLAEFVKKKQIELDQQKELVRNAISNLKKVRSQREPLSDYKYFEGILGIKSLWNEIGEIIDKKDILRIYTRAHLEKHPLIGFNTEFHKSRIKKKVSARMIFPEGEKEIAIKRKKLPLTEVRFIEMNSLAEWGVANDCVLIQQLATNPRGFLIKDPVFAETFREVFDKVWEITKK